MTTPLRRRFAAHLRTLRAERGLTQEELAEQSGLAVDTIRRIERAAMSPTLDSLGKLAEGLHTSLYGLFVGLERGERNRVEELNNFLAVRSERDVRMAYRVVRAMFDARDRK